MTEPALRKACAAFEPVAPVTVEDCREIFTELKQSLPSGATGAGLDVIMVDDHTIRVHAGDLGSRYSVDLQAKN